MPFALNDATRFISPTKTLEYLAAGKPVVSTAIADVVRPYGVAGIVRIADGASVVGEIGLAMRRTDAERKAADAFIASTSWDRTWSAMHGLMLERLGPSVATENHAQFDYLVVGAALLEQSCGKARDKQLDLKVAVCDHARLWAQHVRLLRRAGILVHNTAAHLPYIVEAYLRVFSHFTAWRPYEHHVWPTSRQVAAFPINLHTINRLYGLALSSEELADFFRARAEPIARPRTSEEAVVSKIGRELYDKFFKSYTRKQWGLDPSQLDASVAARVPARLNTDSRYFTDEYQFMPLHGYTPLFERMLDHPNITVMLDVDFREVQRAVRCEQVRRREQADAGTQVLRAIAQPRGVDTVDDPQHPGDAAPLREVGLHDGDRARRDQRVEGGVADGVLTGGERHRRRIGEALPLLHRPIGAQRLLEPGEPR